MIDSKVKLGLFCLQWARLYKGYIPINWIQGIPWVPCTQWRGSQLWKGFQIFPCRGGCTETCHQAICTTADTLDHQPLPAQA